MQRPSPDKVNLPGLRTRLAFRGDFVVDLELRLAERLVVLAGTLARELHAEGVLARLELG
jgi:hypothetical protein